MAQLSSWVARIPGVSRNPWPKRDALPVRLILALAALLLCSALLLLAVGGYHAGFLTLNRLGRALPETFWAGCTVLGDTRLALVLLLFVVVRKPQLLPATLLAAIPCTLLVQLSKRLNSLERPPKVFDADSYHQIGVVLKSGSFPSGHSATFAVLTALILCVASRGWVRYLALLALLLVASSRVMVGVHWPVDVLVGSATGLLSGLGGFYLAQRFNWGTRPLSQWLVMLFPLYAALSVPFYHSGYPMVHLWMVLISAAAVLTFLQQRFALWQRFSVLPGS